MSGRDVEQIVRDPRRVGIGLKRDEKRRSVKAKAEAAAESRILDALVGPTASQSTRDAFRRRLRNSELDDKEVELELAVGGPPDADVRDPGMPGAAMGAVNLGDMLGKALGGGRTKPRRMSVRDAYAPLIAEESDKLLDQDAIVQEAIREVEDNASCSSTRSTRSAPARAVRAPTCRARACSATCCR